MKTESEIIDKYKEIKRGLAELENKSFFQRIKRKEAIQIEFHKNNIAFIEWALDIKQTG